MLAGGLLSGLTLGVVARLWMRWISTDPEFSWSGTIFIIGAFTISITVQSIVLLLRGRFQGKRATTLVRIGGVIFTLPIFGGAGAIMFPTVALTGIALWSTQLDKRLRGVLIVFSLIVPIKVSSDLISDFGWTIATSGRILLFATIYGAVVVLIRPTIMPFLSLESDVKTSSLRKSILIVALALTISALFFLFTVGLSSN